MTELLTDLMHDKADSLGAPDLDVLAMVHEGNRRVTRRRTAILGGVAAVVVAAAVLVPGLADRDRPGSLVATAPAGSLTYAVGSTIHTGAETIDVGREIMMLVDTSSGFVVADEQATVFSVIGDDVVKVGQMDPDRFSGISSDGDVVAWVEDDADGAEYAVLDQATGTDVLRALVGTPPDLSDDCAQVCSPLHIVSVDDRTLYLDDADGLLVWRPFDDVEPELIPTVGDQPPVVLDGAGGTIARRFAGQVRLARDLGEGLIIDTLTADLSPGGRYLLSEGVATWDTGQQPRVFDVSTGEDLPVDIGSANQAVGYRWLDEDTFGVSAYGADGSDQRLLTCEVPSGECATVMADTGDQSLLLPSR